MMALVTVWNIDFTPLSELQDKQLEAIDTPEGMPEDMTDAGNAYVEKGMVYQDPKTGKYYMVTEDKDAMDSDLASQGTSSGNSTSSDSSSSSSSSSSPPTEAPGRTNELSFTEFYLNRGYFALYYPQTCLFGFWNIGVGK